jgi:hypothetical protein
MYMAKTKATKSKAMVKSKGKTKMKTKKTMHKKKEDCKSCD